MSEESPRKSLEVELSHGGKTKTVEVAPEIVEAIFVDGANPLLYVSTVSSDLSKVPDSFANTRQRILNAVLELQEAEESHQVMQQSQMPIAHARAIAEQQAILVLNMLVQAGEMEKRVMRARTEAEGAIAKDTGNGAIHLP